MIQPGNARRRGILVVAYAVLAISCGDALSPENTDVERVEVSPSAASLTVGETRAITAQVYDASGARLVNRRVVWTTQNATVATVSQSGVITGTGSGNTQIAASAGGKSALVAVSVNARPVSLVRVVPPTATVQTGTTITLAAEALDASGAEVIGRPVSWTSSNSAVASVSAAGQVSGVATGTATITATIDGIDGTATVTVTTVPASSVRITPATGTVQQGGALQLTATALDGTGAELPGRTATWSSSNESIATVSSTGRVVGIAEGAFTITARIDAASGTGSYSVTKIPVGLVTVSPSNVTLSVGQTQPMTVNLFAADKTTPLPVAGRIITWTSSNTAVVSVSSSGVVTGVSSGSATITATTEGVSGTATVNVTAVPIATIAVTPSPATVVEGGTTTLVATARDAGGNALVGRTIFWSSSNPQVSVSQAGVVTAVVNSATQTASITASAPGGGVGGSTPSAVVNVSVTYAPVNAVSLAPPSQTITVSQTTTFALTLQDAGGQSLTPTGRTISWQSLNPAIVSVDATGAVTGVSQGGPVGIEVSAASPGQATPARDTGFVTVSNVPVASVTVTPDPATVHVGSSYARVFTAVTRDGSGNVLTGRSILWTSSNQPVATVDPTTGVVTGVNVGSATITATSEGVPGTASVTVDLVAISSVVVSPPSVTLSPGATQVLTWVAQDSAGNQVTGAALGGRAPGWVSSNTAAATVSTSGVVTAVAQGTATVTGTIGTASGASTVTVVTPVSSVDFTAAADSLILPGVVSGTITVFGAGSVPLSGRTVTLTSAPPGLVSVSPPSATSDVNGQVAVTITGVAAGNASITATSETQSDAVSVRVLAGINAIALTPSTDSIIGTGALGLTATVSGASGPLPGRPLTILSSNPAVLDASPSTPTSTNGAGQVAITLTAIAPGSSTVSVTSPEGASTSRVVRVLAPVDHVTISAPGDSVLGTGTLQATATAFDVANNPLPGRLITWAASGDATVDASGLITGTNVTAPGSAAVTATSEGKAAALLVRVLVGVNSVTVGAPDSTVFVGDTQQAVATLRDANNNPITGRVVTWSSTNSAIADVDATGLITANAPGNVTITAMVPAENKSGTMPFSVSLVPADSVVVSPLNPQAAQGASLSFTATVYGGGNVLLGRTVTWSSSDNSLLTIDPNTGAAQVKNKAGIVTVTATTTPGTGPGNTATGVSIVTIP